MIGKILDEIPLATVTFLAGTVLIVLAYCESNITFDEAFRNLLFLGGGSGAIGYVRTLAGRGNAK